MNDKENAIELKHASDCKSLSHDEMIDLFTIELGKYQKNPEFQTLQNMKYLWLWAIHDSHEVATFFNETMKWAGIKDIYSEFKKHGWGGF